MKQSLKTLLYLGTLILLFIITMYTSYNLERVRAMSYEYLNVQLMCTSLAYLLLGVGLNLQELSLQNKIKTSWKVDYQTLFLVALPSLLLAFVPIQYVMLWAQNNLSLFTNVNISQFDSHNFEIFLIIAGFMIAKSFYKEKA